jgi:hypothetical protein
MTLNGCTPYSEYFSVNKGYYPEINPDSVKDPENRWSDTYPHKSFIKLLNALERMLARETSGKKHSIWVHGSFGTGKSRVIWAINQLLTCSDKELCDYFNEHPALKDETDLRDKLLAHKHGRIVTAFRYASGEIDSIRKLIMAVYESVSDALKKAGYNEIGEKTLRGRIADWLGDEANQQIFKILIDKPQYRGLGSFAGKTPKDIFSQLNGSGECSTLINDILTLSENENVGVYNLNMNDLKEWLTEVIDTNSLTALVFMWDEFSAFFRMNSNAVDVLQSLTELCSAKPFEMVIITHQAGSLVDEKDPIKDRFERVEIEMPDNVAFDLIAYHALKPNSASAGTWEEYKNDLAGNTTESMNAVQKAIAINEDVLRGMFPIQPMAALMLKYIAETFASNQRSMFNFIKNEDSDDLRAFQWFIKNHSPENRELLTIDYLWNFFYEKGHDEHGSGAGRSNLDTIIAGILDTYPANEQKLNEEQRRVLKVVLMMQAISRKRNNGVALLRPTEANIKLAFEGVEDSFTTAPHLILKNQLVTQKKILFSSPAENDIVEYATAAIQGDQIKIDDKIDDKRKNTRTTRLIGDAKLGDVFNWGPPIRMRFQFTTVCVENFTVELGKASSQTEDFHIRGLICFARNEEEQKKMRQMIADARKDEVKRKIVIIDGSGIPFGIDNFEEWCKYAGNEEYWRQKDPKLADNHKAQADKKLSDWFDAVKAGSFLVSYGDEIDRQPHTIKKLNDEVLFQIVFSRFTLSFDNAHVSENFFKADKHKDGAKRGIKQEPGGIFQHKDVTSVLKGAWGVPKYWEFPDNASLPIVKLKKELDAFVHGKLDSDIRVSQKEIYNFLGERGFTPCNLYAFLTGFLLKEYSVAPYRYGIGESGEDGDTMSEEKLGEHIGEYFNLLNKPDNKYKDKFIEIMSVDQKAFVDFTTKAFEVPENYSVEKAATRMRSWLKQLGYPIWCFKTIDTHNLGVFIDRIADIANDQGGDNVPSLAKKLGRMFIDFPSASDNLVKLLTAVHGEEAMMEFLRDFREGQLISLAKDINAPNLLEDVREKLSSGETIWLWDQDKGEEELDKLSIEYKIIRASNELSGNNTLEESHGFHRCLLSWKDCAKYTHIPAATLREKQLDLKLWVSLLFDLANDGTLASDEKKNEFLEELTSKETLITSFLSERPLLFAQYYASNLVNLEDDAKKRIYYKLPASSFTDNKADFVKNVNTYAEQERSAQAKNRLIAMWKDVSGFDNPLKWSEYYKTPVLALISTAEQDKARKLFSALIGNPSESEINSAIKFLQSNPAFLPKLKNQAEIDADFRRTLVGKYSAIVSVEEAREELEQRSSSEPYYWMDGNGAVSIIREKADNKYQSGANVGILSKIEDMGEGKAKEYLKRLVRDKLDVGIEILNEEGV